MVTDPDAARRREVRAGAIPRPYSRSTRSPGVRVLADFEDRVQAGDLEDAGDEWADVDQGQLAAGPLHLAVQDDEGPELAALDVLDVPEVQVAPPAVQPAGTGDDLLGQPAGPVADA